MPTNRKSPEASARTSGTVVVGVHGSRSSLRALRHAAGVAHDRGWDLEIVTAWPDADDPLIHDVPGRYITARGHAVECQRRALATLDQAVAVDVDTFLVNARPAEALMSRCDDANLLVVGAGQPEWELGRPSVAAECVEAAPCTVTVVPNPEAKSETQPAAAPAPPATACIEGRRSVERVTHWPSLLGPAERPTSP